MTATTTTQATPATPIFGTVVTRNGMYGPYWTLVGIGASPEEAIANAGPAASEFGIICVNTRKLTDDDEYLIEHYWENR
jgi:hypothetical protein